MSSAFFSHVPVWVWGLLAALIALGLSATRTRQKTRWKALAMPVAMTAFSAYGVISTFATNAPALIAWVSALVIAVALRAALGWWGNVRWVPATRCVELPGSWLPLGWMLAVFALKFSVAVSLAFHPELMAQGGFAAWICLVYGALSGIFFGRVLAIRRAIRRARQANVPGSPSMAV